jgi:hypothetical protein
VGGCSTTVPDPPASDLTMFSTPSSRPGGPTTTTSGPGPRLGGGKAGKVWQGRTWRGMACQMQHPTDDEIMRALCCGAECAVGPKNTGYCHRWDFTSEAARIRALLDRHGGDADVHGQVKRAGRSVVI